MPTRLPVPALLLHLVVAAGLAVIAARATTAGSREVVVSLAAVPVLLLLGALAPRLAGSLPAPVGVVLAWVAALAWGATLGPTLAWWASWSPWRLTAGAALTAAVLAAALGARPLREAVAPQVPVVLLAGTAGLLGLLRLQQVFPTPAMEAVATAGVPLVAAALVVAGVAVAEAPDDAVPGSRRAALGAVALVGPLALCFTGLLPLVG